jgi:hypothetical protein
MSRTQINRYKDNNNKIEDEVLKIPTEGVNIHDTILGILKELRMSIDLLLNTNTDEQYDCLERLIDENMQLGVIGLNKNTKAKAIPIGFRVLMIEILKNALAYANAENPQLRLFWKEKEDCFEFSAENNGTIDEKTLQYINQNENQNEVNKIGITTMRTILNFKYFNQAQINTDSNARWKISIEKLENGNIKFNLIITKSDIYV